MSLNGARLTWFGHATWLLETPGGKRVLFDPWFTGNPRSLRARTLGRSRT
jgi:L-ascorbate metabolism protein UlaG (beta-lactamase superfamily)